jgi:hypothetical protein
MALLSKPTVVSQIQSKVLQKIYGRSPQRSIDSIIISNSDLMRPSKASKYVAIFHKKYIKDIQRKMLCSKCKKI